MAEYPETGTVDQAFDERRARSCRLRRSSVPEPQEHNVKRDMTWEEARKLGLKIVRSRWVDGWKALPDDLEGVRSRYVAQEINNYQSVGHFTLTHCIIA